MRSGSGRTRLTGIDGESALAAGRLADQEVFARVYEAYYPKVFSYAMRSTMNVAVAEDITSQTFLKALAGADGFDRTKGTLTSWLYRIAANAMKDHFRRSNRESLLPSNSPTFDALLAKEMLAPCTVTQGIEKFEQYRRLHAAIRQLKPVYRLTVVLHYFEKQPLKEIASIMGCRVVTAKWRLYRARRLLAALLAGRVERKVDRNED